MNKKIAGMITDIIITRLQEMIDNNEQSTWRKPWITTSRLPVNYITRKKYRGANMIILGGFGEEFITKKQLNKLREKDKSIKFKKGVRQLPVLYFNWTTREKENENGDKVEYKVPFVRYYKVYNIMDIENLPSQFSEQEVFEHEAI